MLLDLQSFPNVVNKKNSTDNNEVNLEYNYLKSKKVDEESADKKVDEELEEDEDEELEEDEDKEPSVSKSNRKNTAKKTSNSKDIKNIDLTPINKSFDKSFKEIQKIQQTVQTLQKSLKNVEKQSMLNKQIQSEVREINKKLMKIEKNTTSTAPRSQPRNVNSKAITNKKTDNKKKKGK